MGIELRCRPDGSVGRRIGRSSVFAGRQTSMPGRNRSGFWIAGVLGLAGLAALSWVVLAPGRRHGRGAGPVVLNEQTPTSQLTEALREGDARALLIVFARVATAPGAPRQKVTQGEAKELAEIASSLRSGFLRFSGCGRTSSLKLVGQILDRFSAEETPAIWFK